MKLFNLEANQMEIEFFYILRLKKIRGPMGVFMNIENTKKIFISVTTILKSTLLVNLNDYACFQ